MAAAEEQTRLQIGHVLFIDIVGYSKLLVNQQSELLRELNEVVSGTNEFREAEAEGKLIRLPTGDGMALVFRTDPEAPAQCALEIARALKEHPRIALRMGIHSGPVNEVVDVNERPEHRRRRDQHGPTSDGLWRCRSHPRLQTCG